MRAERGYAVEWEAFTAENAGVCVPTDDPFIAGNVASFVGPDAEQRARALADALNAVVAQHLAEAETPKPPNP